MHLPDKISAVRQYMADKNISAFLVPRADEYLGEYVPKQNERLAWISGFTGSAGMLIITQTKAVLFVDGRYTIQVQQQCSVDTFEFEHLIENPPLQWLTQHLDAGDCVGFDSRLHSYQFYSRAHDQLSAKNIILKELVENPIDLNWLDRPNAEIEVALLLKKKFTGETSLNKRQRIGQKIQEQGADAALISQLDSIAWLLNIRGNDVPHLPVIMGQAILYATGDMAFCTNLNKIPDGFSEHVGAGVEVFAEETFNDLLQTLGKENQKIIIDSDNTNTHAVLRCIEHQTEIIQGVDPVLLPKAQKNSAELNGMRQCHIRDGSAVSRYLHWIETEVKAQRFHDEGFLSDRLEQFRRDLPDLVDLSFSTISAAGSNAAMAHYSHTNGTPAKLSANTLYLVDSGGQYLDGTTDITRTVAIGQPSAEHREMFTRVLKGHIALASAIFPKGTAGNQLDILARQPLWDIGLDFDHGTGHGVGCFLSVHEGPQRIAKTSGPSAALLPGMVLSNEPGFYKENSYGIRCENLMIVKEHSGDMLEFETITFAPFDQKLIDEKLMTETEIIWLNQYHQQVVEKLAPLLENEALQWLHQATSRFPMTPG
jgi:Xaa-Pro aminopeptidase